MSTVVLEERGPVAVVRLANGVTNAIGTRLVQDLAAAVDRVRAEFRGMVLAGNAKFFSIGLNLPELVRLEPEAMAAFWTRFEDLVLAIYTLPMPTACAICGHAPAGGTILALACDFRFAAAGRKLMGLNEIQIGLAVPFIADRMLRQIAGDAACRRLEYSGELLACEEAHALGLVDEIVAEEAVEGLAVERIAALAARPAGAFALTKRHRVRNLPEEFSLVRAELGRDFMARWFSPDAQALMAAAAAKY